MQEGKPIARLLECISELTEKPSESSMNVWYNYWLARGILRKIAMAQYEHVTSSYIENDEDTSFPEEGFIAIADDISDQLEPFSITIEQLFD